LVGAVREGIYAPVDYQPVKSNYSDGLGDEASDERISDILGVLLSRRSPLSFFLLAYSVGSLLLRSIVRVRFLMVLVATAAEEKQNLLRVGTAHIASLAQWQVVEKRSTVAIYGNP
jgi:hypothetical protein